MRVLWPYGLALTLLAGAGLGSLQADPFPSGGPAPGSPSFIFNFDENGNATYQTFNPITMTYNPPVAETGTLIGGVLTYRLPGFVVVDPMTQGYVVLREPPPPANQISDVVQFGNDAQGGFMRYWSEEFPGGDGIPQLADIGIPDLGNIDLTDILANEVGAEGGTSFSFFSGGIGTPASSNFFNGISDISAGVIPEPGSLTLLGLGLGFAGLYGAVRRRRSAVLGFADRSVGQAFSLPGDGRLEACPTVRRVETAPQEAANLGCQFRWNNPVSKVRPLPPRGPSLAEVAASP
jgi:hypothetical protein